jgi:citrate lyase beta subunit
VPQVTSPSDIEFVDTLVGMVEQRIDLAHRIDIEAEIATAQGLALLDEIALASDDRWDVSPQAKRRRPPHVSIGDCPFGLHRRSFAQAADLCGPN